jgi:hypothetical protein
MWGGRCYLELPGCTGEATTMDHVIPIARNGANWPSNRRPICKTCNQRKGAKPWRQVLALAEETRVVRALLILLTAGALACCHAQPKAPPRKDATVTLGTVSATVDYSKK